jgi:hypothetical protein
MSNPFSEFNANAPSPSTGSLSAPHFFETPGVVMWSKVFCVAMAIVCFGAAAFSVLTLIVFSNPGAIPAAQQNQAGPVRVVYSVILALSIIGCVSYIVFPFLQRNATTWVFGMVLIGLSLITFCGTIPAVILMVFWASERTRRYYGVSG